MSMSKYSVDFKPSVEKDFRGLPDSVISIIIKRVDDLMVTPFPSQAVKLSGTQKTFRIRVKDYRILYEVDTERKKITVLYIRHRSIAYRKI